MLNHRTCLILSLNAFNRTFLYHSLWSQKLRNLSSTTPDDLNQFNEKLIEKIKSSQLFNIQFCKLKNDLNENQSRISLSSEVQRYLPSVSKVISETMTEENLKVLEIWKAKMIKKLGADGFQKYQKDLFSRGTRLHKNIEHKLKNNEENIKIDEDINGYWMSLQPILNEINNVHLIEEKLTHPCLLYKGIVDCVAQLNKVDMVVDWKTSEKVKDTKTKLYDAPVQTAAYLGALNQSDLLDFEITKMAVVISYKDGRVANYHQLNERDCTKFWNVWIQKLEQYWIKILAASPADPGLLSHFDDLIALADENRKKIYHFNNKNENALKGDSFDLNDFKSFDSKSIKSKTHKTKAELEEILRSKKQKNVQVKRIEK